MRSKLAPSCAGTPRLIDRRVRSVTRACMQDTTGNEIKRHLNGCEETFALAVHDAALGDDGAGGFVRTWGDEQARRIATKAILFAYECQESTYRGERVWLVRGFSRKAIELMSTVRYGPNARKHPDGSTRTRLVGTTTRDLKALSDAGVIAAELSAHEHQYAAHKVPDWCKGPVRTTEHGEVLQWAYRYYYVRLCPFGERMRARVRPGRFDHAFRSDNVHQAHPFRSAHAVPKVTGPQLVELREQAERDATIAAAIERNASQQAPTSAPQVCEKGGELRLVQLGGLELGWTNAEQAARIARLAASAGDGSDPP